MQKANKGAKMSEAISASDKFLGIYLGKCSECGAEGRVMNDPAGFRLPFCQNCYEDTFC